MEWILQNIPLLAFIFVVISIVRAVLRAREMQEESKRGGNESEQQRRIREVQEEIRRKIAERRGDHPGERPGRLEAPEPERPPVFESGSEPPPVDPFGGRGTLRRLMEQWEQKMEAPPPLLPTANRLELERQQQLEDELQAAEELRQQTRRRVANIAAARESAAQSETVLRRSARDRLLADLSEPESLRRALVLREVLGPPVGLR